MPDLCNHADCKRHAHYGAECCRHSQLWLPLQLALVDSAGRPVGIQSPIPVNPPAEHCHHEAEQEPEEFTPACPIQNCGAPADCDGLCQRHRQAASALRLGKLDSFRDDQMGAIYALGEVPLDDPDYRLFLAKTRWRIGTGQDSDREIMQRHTREVNAELGTTCGARDGAKSKPCFHPRGHDGVHSNGSRTWRDRKPKAKPAPSPEDQALDDLERNLALAEAEAKRREKKAPRKKRAPAPPPADVTPGACSVTLCGDPGAAEGLCAKHFRKARRLGIPMTGTYTLAQVDLLSGRTKPPKEKR